MATKRKPHVVSLSIEELAQGIQEAAARLLETRAKLYHSAWPVGDDDADRMMRPDVLLEQANNLIDALNDGINHMAGDLVDIQKRAAAIERWAADPKTDGQAAV